MNDQLSVLVVGIGNPDRGDDGIGPMVARQLKGRVPLGVNVLELYDDVLALIEKWDEVPSVIVVDAVASITRPGLIYRLDLSNNRFPLAFAPRSTHAFGLAETVELARNLGRLPGSVVAYLIEGEQFETGASLSPVVAKAVEAAVERILMEISSLLERRREHA
jgi:hydrogenase maturation protease